MNIFNIDRGKSYSATSYPMLTSTVVRVCGSPICVYCGDKAKYVQEPVRCYDGIGHNYIDRGFRCTCKYALNEMANRIAFDMLDDRDFKYPKFEKLPDDVIDVVFSSNRVKEAVSGGNPFNIEFVHGEVCSGKFLQSIDGDMYFIHDEHPIKMFMDRVTKTLTRLIENWEAKKVEQKSELDQLMTNKWIVECKK